MTGLSRGVRLGVDVGQVRVGVAISDPHGILATPLVTLARDSAPASPAGDVRPVTDSKAGRGPTSAAASATIPATAAGSATTAAGSSAVSTPAEGAVPAAVPAGTPTDIAELRRLVQEHEAVEVVVGLPINLAGKHGPAAVHVQAYADRLAGVIAPVPVTLTDERMSTVVASRRLAERGVRGKRQRAVVDQAAAVEILQSWLDAQRRRT